jgi:succinoglycan biosynthesis protein ExoA
LPLGVMPAVVLALAAPVMPLAAVPALAWIVLCLAYGVGIGIRRRSVAATLSGPIALVIHFAWSYGFWDFLLRTFFGSKQ